MGFSSYLCRECGMSVYNHTSVRAVENLSSVAVVLHDGTVIHGVYDGYGRVSGVKLYGINVSDREFVEYINSKEEYLEDWKRDQARVESGERDERTYWHQAWTSVEDIEENFSTKVPAVYHRCCFDEERHGVYEGGSERCPDQGHFVSDTTIYGRIRNNERFMENYQAYNGDFTERDWAYIDDEFSQCEECKCYYYPEDEDVKRIVFSPDEEMDICMECIRYLKPQERRERALAFLRISGGDRA